MKRLLSYQGGGVNIMKDAGILCWTQDCNTAEKMWMRSNAWNYN